MGSQNGTPKGCQSGGCASGGCNRLNTFDWLSTYDVVDTDPFEVVEVSFKNGARKTFFRNPDYYRPTTGDMVVVETGNGYDVGRVTLSGELVRLQLRKKKVDEESVMHTVVRKANSRDLERLQEARDLEHSTMTRARAIARTLGLEMKIGDVEYQGDKRKATFYYTADGRVDFRELIRHYAKEFRVKIEMRQIGARQESARIGGIGSCGRELCCSTWLTDFRSVSTAAARYQNLAINQAKLSGQCGRLKCCLNYELDTYLEALEYFPENVDKLETAAGKAVLIKTDIFKKIMYYAYDHDHGRGKIYALMVQQVKEIKAMNAKGEKPADLGGMQAQIETPATEMDYEDVTGVIELPEEEKRRRKKKKRGRGRGRGSAGEESAGGGPKRMEKVNKPTKTEGGANTSTPDGQGQKDGNRGSSRKRRSNRRRKK